jgi:mono/diheme cytochrome c family protein
MSKLIVSFFLALAVMACGGKKPNKYVAKSDGEAIFKKYCITCHGADGKLKLNGAKDLSISQLSLAEKVIQITKGKNTMTPFEGILSPAEIQAVAEYTLTLIKK